LIKENQKRRKIMIWRIQIVQQRCEKYRGKGENKKEEKT
jgi:hypothetical protein